MAHDPRARTLVAAKAATSTSASDPDVAIQARAAARELRVVKRGSTRVRVDGSPGLRRDDSTRRQNLPDRVEQDRTYRDIRISRRIAGRIDPSRGES